MSRTSVSRRTALGALGTTAGMVTLGAGLTGCSVDSTVDALKAPTPGTPTPSVDSDLRLVDSVVAAMRAADHGAPHAFARLHEAQINALGAGDPASPSAGQSPSAAPTTATGSWQTRQKALPETLIRAAVAAADADLVRLLSSSAAAQRQLLHARGLG